MNSGKTLTTFVVVLVVSFAVMSVLPDDGLSRACLQEALLAAVAIGAVAFACPRAIRRVRCTNSVQHGMVVGAAVVLVGALGGAITLAPGFWRLRVCWLACGRGVSFGRYICATLGFVVGRLRVDGRIRGSFHACSGHRSV